MADEEGIALYNHLIDNYTANKLVIISSNDYRSISFVRRSWKSGNINSIQSGEFG